MTDQEFINALVDRKVISSIVGQKLLKDASVSGKYVEDLIYDRKISDELTIAKAKSEIFGIPLYQNFDIANINDALLKFIPFETSQNYSLVPLEKNDEMLVVGMLRPDSIQAQEALRFIAKQNHISIGVYIVTPSVVKQVWKKYKPFKSEIEAALQGVSAVTQPTNVVGLEEGGKGEEAPIIKIVAATLKQAVDSGASDVHIEPQRERLRIRFRINGELQEVSSLPLVLSQPIVSRVKVLSNLKLDETRIPQDGRFRTVVFGRDIDFRVSTFPTPSGEKVAIRVLDPETGLKSFNDLGLNDYNFNIVAEGIHKPYGMILISGPTGSGKTTTLYAIMQQLNTENVNIVSLEDPVEYFMEGINQSQVHPEIGYDFASGLREILRQDPDIIMVGEIRDKETANLAVNAALTGHIMLSTIHTNNAVGVIPRLLDLEAPSFLLSSSLNLMIAQRLVLKLCPKCKKQYQANDELSDIIQNSLETLPENVKMKYNYSRPYTLYKAEPDPNCDICGGKGVKGRIALFEIFKMTKELDEIISTGITETKLMEEAKRQGMVTLRQDGIIKALQGQISIEEVLRETK
ncbi:MAG: GspE/PulE family protein [Minisyncoccia bacterium]